MYHLKETVMLRSNILLAVEHVNTGVAATLVRLAIPIRWEHLEGHTDLGKAVSKGAFSFMALPVFADGILRCLYFIAAEYALPRCARCLHTARALKC